MTTPPSPGYEIDGLASSISCLSLSRQKPQSFKKFLQLPTEIRLQVFEHLLSSPTEKRFPHPLLAVSKDVRNESAPLVFKSVTLKRRSRMYPLSQQFAFGGKESALDTMERAPTHEPGSISSLAGDYLHGGQIWEFVPDNVLEDRVRCRNVRTC